MRSRYSAYVLRDWGYLADSWHPSTRPDPDALLQGAQPSWLALEIVQTRVGVHSNEAFVEFRARFRDGEQQMILHENSRFLREQGEWRYVDGHLYPTVSLPITKAGRNAPCPCGSGRKYKRCCGR